jgi:hypothetical protein
MTAAPNDWEQLSLSLLRCVLELVVHGDGDEVGVEVSGGGEA